MSAVALSVTRADRRLPLALTMMVASGAAALGYQMVWTQQCALWLGHEAAAGSRCHPSRALHALTG